MELKGSLHFFPKVSISQGVPLPKRLLTTLASRCDPGLGVFWAADGARLSGPDRGGPDFVGLTCKSAHFEHFQHNFAGLH